VRSAAAGAQIIEAHLVFDLLLEGQGCFPVDLGRLGQDDAADERIGAIRTFAAAGSQVGFGFELLAALTIIELSARGELSNRYGSK
jgi:hypothetical protein